MWRPTTPNHSDPGFWLIVGGVPLGFGLVNGAPILSSLLVGGIFVSALWIVRR